MGWSEDFFFLEIEKKSRQVFRGLVGLRQTNNFFCLTSVVDLQI